MNRFKDYISGDTCYKAELAKFCLAQTSKFELGCGIRKDTHKESVTFFYSLNYPFKSIGNWHLGLLRKASHLCSGHSAILADGHECWHAENQYVHHV